MLRVVYNGTNYSHNTPNPQSRPEDSMHTSHDHEAHPTHTLSSLTPAEPWASHTMLPKLEALPKGSSVPSSPSTREYNTGDGACASSHSSLSELEETKRREGTGEIGEVEPPYPEPDRD